MAMNSVWTSYPLEKLSSSTAPCFSSMYLIQHESIWQSGRKVQQRVVVACRHMLRFMQRPSLSHGCFKCAKLWEGMFSSSLKMSPRRQNPFSPTGPGSTDSSAVSKEDRVFKWKSSRSCSRRPSACSDVTLMQLLSLWLSDPCAVYTWTEP